MIVVTLYCFQLIVSEGIEFITHLRLVSPCKQGIRCGRGTAKCQDHGDPTNRTHQSPRESMMLQHRRTQLKFDTHISRAHDGRRGNCTTLGFISQNRTPSRVTSPVSRRLDLAPRLRIGQDRGRDRGQGGARTAKNGARRRWLGRRRHRRRHRHRWPLMAFDSRGQLRRRCGHLHRLGVRRRLVDEPQR